ncbi:DUF4191 family protein [Arachnia propionica]|uniref:DUF4191 family protein n=1 Tax=Arachnia propionica TaxID=1750 RepID=A0A3P1T2Y1_9ACTN|nr:DUF4191 domain-containing protein [Arachnia propionica]MDO5082287.1 DUF4191 domain-containing protein [Arachnia propionica]RRD03495.1 DUF4191 family protein [Arachnia propionica]
MARSERAKELARKQKEQAKAEKLRRKNSDNPADWGQLRQIRETYKITKKHDPRLPWILLAAWLGPFVLFLVLGFLLKAPIMWGIMGVMVGMLVAMWIFVRRAKRAAYARYDGQVGSAELAMQMLGKKWKYTPVVAATRNRDSADVVHRAIGPGGLVLIGEGDPKHLKALLASEKKKHEQVAYGVNVVTFVVGKGGGQVPLDKLADEIKKLPKALEAAKVVEVEARLKALDAMRPKLPMPKGPMPTGKGGMKGARQAMRGR